MSFNLYDATVAVFIRDLNNMKGVLKKGEAWCDEQGKPHSALLEHRLAPDMQPLTFQIHTCLNYAKFTLVRIGKTKDFVVEDNQKTFPELYARIDNTIKILQEAKREDFDDVDKSVALNYPGFSPKFTAKSYAQKMVLPNFFFHETATYLILRNAGVPLGKGDFLDSATVSDA